MSKPYREYAEECRLLAERMPEDRARLLDLARAWDRVAEEAEQSERPEAVPRHAFPR